MHIQRTTSSLGAQGLIIFYGSVANGCKRFAIEDNWHPLQVILPNAVGLPLASV